jgi:hypothetical protein
MSRLLDRDRPLHDRFESSNFGVREFGKLRMLYFGVIRRAILGLTQIR